MYLTYDSLPADIQTFLICYQQDTPGVEPWEVLYAWYQVDEESESKIQPAEYSWTEH